MYRWIVFCVLCLVLMACQSKPNPEEQAKLNSELLEAVGIHDLDKVEVLLAEGADANATDGEGTAVLFYAVNDGGLQLCEKLLEKGANVNARRATSYHSSCLMEAAVRNDTSMANLLLKYGADVHMRDTFGDPAINWAAYYGHTGYVNILLRAGAKWDVESKHGTAIEVAMKQWNDHLIDYFIEKGAGEPIEAIQTLRLKKAVQEGDAGVVEALLSEGVSAKQKDELGTPFLTLAASKGQTSIVKLLLEAGADVNALNRVGQSALSRAAYFGHEDIVQHCLEVGARVNLAGERYKLSPLISASIGGHTQIVDALLDNGSDVNAPDEINGYTPLMFAVAYGHEGVVEELLKAGANPYIKSKEGAGLFDLLGYNSNQKIKALLEAYVSEE